MKRHFAGILGLMFAAAVVLLAARVVTDYDHHVDFSSYKTYSFLRVEAGDPLWPDRIRTALESQLAAKGWSRVPDGGDAAVAAFGSTHTQKRLQTFYDGFGGGRWAWRGGFGEAITTVDNVPIGTLVVDIFDSRTNKLIWRGAGSDALTEHPEKDEKKLEKTIEQMFKNFPPRSKG
jgi:hypothetical protein